MRFHLSEEQILIQDSLRRVLKDLAAKRRAAVEAEEDRLERDVWAALMALGVGSMVLPESYGGQELGLLDLALAMEVLGEAAAPGPFLGHVLAGLGLALSSDPNAKAQWLPKLADGSAVGAVAFGEGWEPDSWTASLSDPSLTDHRPTDHRLMGTFHVVPGARHADVILAGIAGGGLALLEAHALGVNLEALDSTDRTRRLAQLRLDAVPCTLLAPPGAPAARRLFDAALILVAADALGGAQRCLDMAVDYAKTREQFGVLIGHFQALKHQLANMALEIEPSRALVWYAAYAFDRQAPEAPRMAAQAKAHLTDRFSSVARAAVEAHGGIGYTWDYDLQIWFRRAIFDRAYLGAPSVHRERAARMAGW